MLFTDPARFYDHYRFTPPDMQARLKMHMYSGMILKPVMRMAEGVEAALDQNNQEDVRHLMAITHSTVFDQQVIAAMMWGNPLFHGRLGKVDIPGKIEYSKYPRLRQLIESWGEVPIVRKEDMPKGTPKHIQEAISAEVHDMLLHNVIVNGRDHAQFPEKTRKGHKHDQLGRVYQGIAKLACDAVQETEGKTKVAIIPMGVYWGDHSEKIWLRRLRDPDLYVGYPMPVGLEDNIATVMMKLRPALECALGEAVSASREREPTRRLVAYRMAKRILSPPGLVDGK